MRRRRLLTLICTAPLLAVPVGAGAQEIAGDALSLYGMPLKGASAARFLQAAREAGNRPRGDAAPPAGDGRVEFDARGAGVPALEELAVLVHDGKVAAARFRVKGYGEDNAALRRLLQAKYGVPLTVGARPLPFASFDARLAPRGGFQWRFADGTRLVYEHPRLGDVTLTYVDDARMAELDRAAASPHDPGSVRNRI